MTQQLSIFGTTTSGAPSGRRSRFLTELRVMMQALSASPTFAEQLQTCATQVRDLRNGQEHGTHFERALLPLLEAHWDTIRDETLSVLPNVSDVRIRKGPGARAMADLIVTWHHDGGTWNVAVNVKAERPGANSSSNGCAVSSFIRMATEGTWTPHEPAVPIRWPVSRAIVEWVGRRRRILAGRDYYVLAVYVTDDSLVTGHTLTGLLSTTTAGQEPVIERHTNREVVKVKGGSDLWVPLADETDVNATTSRALLPSPSLDDLRLHLLAVLADGAGDRRVVQIAQTLLDLDDNELRRRIRDAVLPRE